ncbi:FAD-dependent oxidoreductase [Streptomyces sp. ISL-11]|nr:NAD(P)/FAD-dependent oxidoreductase [Streptomyces sp. ISL-11]MBT2387587.1 FAD-dependent oxidoreductase [Streptomyces sp. ISL-11]
MEWEPLRTAKKLNVREGAGGSTDPHSVELDDAKKSTIKAGAVIVATGLAWRRLDDSTKANELIGSGVYYQALVTDAEYTKGQEIAMVGGGNSTGQAVVYFAQFAKKVTMIVRTDLSKMSAYLVDEINALKAAGKVEILLNTEVKLCEADGNKQLKNLKVGPKGSKNQANRDIPTRWLYVLIGGAPNTDWLGGRLQLDSQSKTVLTGRDVTGQTGLTSTATSVPGVYAVGDVQFGAPPRVGGAVGRGAAALAELFGYIAKNKQYFPTYAGKPGKNEHRS